MNARGWIAAVASALVALACSGDGSSTPSSNLVGTWNVSKYELVSTSSPSTKVELISQGGTATIVMKSDGTYQGTSKLPGEPSESVTGTWSASSDVLTMTQVGMSGNMQFNYSLSGSTLTLTGADAEWDFNGDGVEEPAKLNIAATKG